ncbi:MAG TPA: DUF72 domain-containing protein [Steroidobacteraceae bacterium]|nr:DUF72 domain-containing protein [Steroidobacteraceae bacterium]
MIRVGTAGWSIAAAYRPAFPDGGTHLARYAKVLPCVEINSSFYRAHARKTYRRWAQETPSGFRFAVKLPREITHEGRLRRSREQLEAFLGQVAGLGRKLGPLLVQLPPSLAYERRAARRFFVILRERHAGAVVCEPRHPSWFEPAAEDLLLALGIGRVAADPAIVSSAKQPGGDRATIYVRLHGSPRKYWSRYTAEALAGWRADLRQWARRSQVWCIFDNTAANAALANALEISGRARGAHRAAAWPPSAD